MSKSNLKYTGNIRVRIYDKKNNLKSTKYYHNNGRWPLFHFISNCLTGNYEEANKYRPYYIGLFSIKKMNDEGLIPQIEERIIQRDRYYINTDIQYYLLNDNQNSKLINTYFNEFQNSQFETQSNSSIGSSNITFTFEIPSDYLKFIATTTETSWKWDEYNFLPINLICLYAKSFKPSVTEAGNKGKKPTQQDDNSLILDKERLCEPLAYCFIPKGDEGEEANKLGNLLNLDSEMSDISKYNIVVDWTLNFNNNLNAD